MTKEMRRLSQRISPLTTWKGGNSPPNISGFVQNIDYGSVNQDLRLRLDMCQEEKYDLEKSELEISEREELPSRNLNSGG